MIKKKQREKHQYYCKNFIIIISRRWHDTNLLDCEIELQIIIHLIRHYIILFQHLDRVEIRMLTIQLEVKSKQLGKPLNTEPLLQ